MKTLTWFNVNGTFDAEGRDGALYTCDPLGGGRYELRVFRNGQARAETLVAAGNLAACQEMAHLDNN